MAAPVTEIINTGSELLLGSILNTHQQWLCSRLAAIGFVVSRQTAVSDSGPDIQTAVGEALQRADLIITTGGLGPTSDDRTREMIADLLGRRLQVDAEALERIEKFFAIRARPIPQSTKVQALAPEGAIVLQNANGTAPGLAIHVQPPQARRPAWLIMLPGPPRELHPMFENQVVPLLLEAFPETPRLVCRILKTTGLGESYLEEAVAPAIEPFLQRGVSIGYCARVGEVDVRLTCCTCDAELLITESERVVRERISEYIYGEGADNLETVLVRGLTARKQTLALAESCTGGYIANRITNVPGASAVFLGGMVTYANEVKEAFLGVRSRTLQTEGAVSRATAEEMAIGVRERTRATFSAAVTGIAGPSGGSTEKPVGTVFIGIAGPDQVKVFHRTNRYDRETFKFVTAQQTLELLRHEIIKSKEAGS